MYESALSRFWQLLGWVLALSPEAFKQINTLPHGSIVAIIVVLVAGLSQTLAQSVILFANRVQPIRFIFTLLLGAVLFAFGYFFLVLSTWIISFAPFTVEVPFNVIARTFGVSYAPLIFSAFGAMPYWGQPILSLLSLWQLLAIVVGFAAVSDTTVWQAFGTVGLGWIVLGITQRTIGQPIANLGRRIAYWVAGVELLTRRQQFLTRIQQSLRSSSRANFNFTPSTILRLNAASVSQSSLETPNYPAQPKSGSLNRPFTIADQWISLVGLAGGTLIAIALLSPIRTWWFAWCNSLDSTFQVVFNLVWIGVIAFFAAALIAPWEALGWWAGWYDDAIEPTPDLSIVAPQISSQIPVKRYVVYLDGIGQSTLDYLADSEAFLQALRHSLPEDVRLIKGIMSYSVRNNPLTGNRPLAFFWRSLDRLRLNNPGSPFGYFVNLRNVLMVAVSADKRYGLIYNFGIARSIYQALVHQGYTVGQSVPITLIGFSGGGQMAAGAAPFLRQTLAAPIELISLGGVMSGNLNFLSLEHLYHLVGDKDGVERIGPVMFPGRWKLFFLSYWNRAKRMGKVNVISLGAVGHQLPGGLMDAERFLPDGRSYLQQTLDWVAGLLLGTVNLEAHSAHRILSNYDRYRQADFNRPTFYPIEQSVPSDRYLPIAPWMGRLILPTEDQRQAVQGVLFEVHHAPSEFQHLIGQIVTLRFSEASQVQAYVQSVTKDVHFSAEATNSVQQGRVHPTRINHWRQVNPLESLAGSHPVNDVMVMLQDPIVMQQSNTDHLLTNILSISRDPIQITGRYYGLVKFIQPIQSEGELFQVIHFDRTSRRFTGAEEIVSLPKVVSDRNQTAPSTARNVEESPMNQTGWYIYGALDQTGRFVVQALAPRKLLQVDCDYPEGGTASHRQITGKAPVKHYLKREVWSNLAAHKGLISKVCLKSKENQSSIEVGKRALLVHVYGGIGGNKTEPAAKSPLYFGHFAYGVATIVWEPLAEELRFEIVYHQIYTHNSNGLIAGSLHWSRYMGDRQFGWLGLRPVADTLIELDGFTGDYEMADGSKRSPLDQLIYQLEIMAARYRIGDGTGGTFVGPAYNCTQDSNQALYAAMRQIARSLQSQPNLQDWKEQHPDQAQKLEQLEQLSKDLKQLLLPWGTARADWKNQDAVLGSTLEDHPLRKIRRSLLSWRTILPRLTSDEVTEAFLKQGGSALVLRTNQVGGSDPDIEPVAPMTL